MKKGFCLLLFSFFLWGCEKKEVPLFVFEPGTELKIWTSTEPEFWEALGREFVAKINVPNLEVEITSFENETELQEVFLHSLAVGKGPDVIFTDGNFIAENKSKFVPLTNDESLTIEKFKRIFVPASHNLFIDDQNLTGVPIGIDTLALIYNTEHLEGLEIPETWEEFKEVSKNLTKTDNSLARISRSGSALGRVDNVRRGVEVLENLLVQMVGNLFSEDSLEAVFAQNQGVTSQGKRIQFGLDALNFFLSFARTPHPNFSWNNLYADNDFEAFLQGKVSMIFGNSRDLALLYYNITERGGTISENHVKVSFFPQFEAPEKSSVRQVLADIYALGVARSTDKDILAWEFLKFAVQKENLRGFFQVTKLPASRVDLLLEQEAETEVFARQAKLALGQSLPLERSKFQTGLKEMVQSINLGKETVEEGFTRLQEEFTRKLQRQKELETKIK
ncbi:extracellular solute-binding protein [Candidatus Gracilibacteria bacterium]|nr:extracellular solute-binding protein [Candidatus Gracilibacteria bacterium]